MRFELALMKIFAWIFRILPHRRAQAFGGFLGGMFHDLVGIRKKVAREQLAASFPEMDERWVRDTVRKSYCHMGILAVETARIPVMKGDEFDKWVVYNGADLALESLEKGRGCLVVSAHLGCWEYQGAWAANRGMPVTYVVAEQTNWLVGEYVDDIRRSVGIEIVKRSDATRGIIKALKRNRLMAMGIDQDARSQGDFVPFFGRLASTFRGVAVFALKMDSAVAVLSSRRLEDGRILCNFRPVEFTPTGNRDKDIYDLTKRLTKILEERIREVPEQYLWLHKRWKTRPPEDWKAPV